MANKMSLREAYGNALLELGRKNPNIVVCDADLANATMTIKVKNELPDQFFDFGIAEANMVCAAAGMSHSGLTPFVSTFAIFGAGRAFEQIRNSVAYVNANVKFGLSHSGLSVGEDGGSHQSIEDIALMRVLPNMTIFVPCDGVEMKKAVFAASEIDGPVYIRVARPVVDVFTDESTPFVPGRANVLKEGADVAIMTMGLMVPVALKAAEMLEKQGVSAAVINHHTIKPFDAACTLEMANRCGKVISIEEHSVVGGLGSAVAETLAGKSSAKFAMIGINDKFGKSGKPDQLFEAYGLTAEHIVDEYNKMK